MNTRNHKLYQKLQSSVHCSEVLNISSWIVSLLVEFLIGESAGKVWSAIAQINDGERDRSSYSYCSLRTPSPLSDSHPKAESSGAVMCVCVEL